jgi:hypothetical protein
MIDTADRVADRLPWVIGGVVLASLLLMLVMFRSVLVPIKAALLTLLSIGAAYGVIVAVFQWGWGLSLLGVEEPVPIMSMVPLFLFAVLFGLSMDYEVFLMAKVRGGLPGHRRRLPQRGHGPRGHRSGDHLGRGDHGSGVPELRRHRQSTREDGRRRSGGRRHRRCHGDPDDARPRADELVRQGRVVVSGVTGANGRPTSSTGEQPAVRPSCRFLSSAHNYLVHAD